MLKILRNCNLSSEATELLLVHDQVDQAINMTLDQGHLTAKQAIKFSNNVKSTDLVGKVLVAFKSFKGAKPG